VMRLLGLVSQFGLYVPPSLRRFLPVLTSPSQCAVEPGAWMRHGKWRLSSSIDNSTANKSNADFDTSSPVEDVKERTRNAFLVKAIVEVEG